MNPKFGTIVKTVCIEYLTKYPTLSTNQIARCMYEENKTIFKDVEAARERLRYYRGAKGAKSRMCLDEKSYMPRVYVPKSEEKVFEPYRIDRYPVAIGSDAHMPYHSEAAIGAFLDHAKKIKAKTILLNGDWMDCYQLSVFGKDPRRRDFIDELNLMKDFLSGMRKEFPKADIIFKEGNHEERLIKYLQNNAALLFGLEEVTLESLLKLKNLDIQWVGDKRVILAEKLHILHGHEYKRSFTNPVNPARGLYLRTKKSAICGHYHQPSEHDETTIDGKLQTCWSTGCLCALNPEYMPLNNWSHGFADVVIDGEWRVHNFRMYNGKVL